MKRFYCTICNKVRRVQKWPTNISLIHSEHPEQRRGECNWHRNNSQSTHARVLVGSMKGGR